jgi:hypothetical protein
MQVPAVSSEQLICGGRERRRLHGHGKGVAVWLASSRRLICIRANDVVMSISVCGRTHTELVCDMYNIRVLYLFHS